MRTSAAAQGVLLVLAMAPLGCGSPAAQPEGTTIADVDAARPDRMAGRGSDLADPDPDPDPQPADAGAETEPPPPPSCPEQTRAGDYRTVFDDDLTPLRGVTQLTGDLKIANSRTLVDLSALACLRGIGGNLEISSASRLVSLAGLENLRSVGGDVLIHFNPELLNLDGFRNLESTGSRFDIDLNGKLQRITVGRRTRLTNLFVGSNARLVDLDGLRAITDIDGQLVVRSNAMLSTLRGTESLRMVGASFGTQAITSLMILGNPRLPLCYPEALLRRLLANGFRGNAEVDGHTGSCP